MLAAFFDTFYSVGLTRAFKHLTVSYPFESIIELDTHCETYVEMQESAFRDGMWILYNIFAVLQKYKIVAELKFPGMRPCWKPMLERVEELCKTEPQSGQQQP